jgi:hypothetical protein
MHKVSIIANRLGIPRFKPDENRFSFASRAEFGARLDNALPLQRIRLFAIIADRRQHFRGVGT